MSRVLDFTETRERLPGRFPANRSCTSCGAILSRYNPSEFCAPCHGGEWGDHSQAHPIQTARLEHELELMEAA